MAISKYVQDNEKKKFKESTSVSGQPGVVVINPDGSPISGASATETVVGNVAAGAADSGNPVKVGGKYNLVLPTLADGQRGDFQLDSNSRLLVNIAAASPDNDGFSIGDAAAPATRANVLAAGTPQSTGNSLLTAAASYAPTFSVASVTGGTVYDVGNYRWVSVQVLTQYVGSTPTITFQVSNDGTNWVAKQLVSTNSATGISANNTTTTGVFEGGLSGRYFRLNFTGTYSSGTATGVIVFSTAPGALTTVNSIVTQTGSWNTSVSATPTVATVSVATSSTTVLASNTSRKAAIFTNVGANNIYLNLAGGTAVATNTLVGPGSTLVWDRFISTTAITGIAATGATNLSVTEMA